MKALDNITINQKYGLVLKEDIEKINCVISKQKKQIERLQEQLDELQSENNNLCNDIVDLNLTIENREKQLNEANEIISTYRCYDDTDAGKATEYCKKCGVK